MAIGHDDLGRDVSRHELLLADRAGPGAANLLQKARLTPAPPALVVRRMRQVEAPARASHGHVQKAALLSDHVLLATHERLEHGWRELETRRPPELRKPSLDERGDKYGFELEALRLMDRHHLHSRLSPPRPSAFFVLP